MIAGGETAGIPFAAWIAERLGLPMIYVRKKPKGFGRNAQIEGTFDEGAGSCWSRTWRPTAAPSSTSSRPCARPAPRSRHCFVIFHYGIFPQSTGAARRPGVKLHGLATWWDALAVAEDSGYLDAGGVAEVRAFLEDPDGWSAAHGGKTSEELAAGG